MSQRLKRLSTRLYTGTDFAEENSVLGNDCIQIFTDDDGFVVVLTIRSKAEVGDKHQWVCRDFGVPNELYMNI